MARNTFQYLSANITINATTGSAYAGNPLLDPIHADQFEMGRSGTSPMRRWCRHQAPTLHRGSVIVANAGTHLESLPMDRAQPPPPGPQPGKSRRPS